MSDDTTAKPAATGNSTALIVTLGVIAMISGLLVVLAFELTKPQIALNKQHALEKAIFAVLPEATTRKNLLIEESGLTVLPDEAFAQANAFAGYNEAGQLTGLAIEGSARGYQDVVRVLFGYSLESECIIGMTILQSTETPGLGDRVSSDPGFLANFECLEARLNDEGTAMRNEIVTVKHDKKTEPWQIDGISGATVTSTAVGTAIRGSTNELLPLLAKHKASLPRNLNE